MKTNRCETERRTGIAGLDDRSASDAPSWIISFEGKAGNHMVLDREAMDNLGINTGDVLTSVLADVVVTADDLVLGKSVFNIVPTLQFDDLSNLATNPVHARTFYALAKAQEALRG